MGVFLTEESFLSFSLFKSTLKCPEIVRYEIKTTGTQIFNTSEIIILLYRIAYVWCIYV